MYFLITFSEGIRYYGITCRDTGYNMDSSLCVSNCRIHFCGAGINISHFSEFHKFNRELKIYIHGGGTVLFGSCVFAQQPIFALQDHPYVKVFRCYTKAGEEV